LPGTGSLERAIFLSRASSVLSLESINGFNIRIGVSRFCSAKQEHFFSIIERKNGERNERPGGERKELSCIQTLSLDINFPFFLEENSYS